MTADWRILKCEQKGMCSPDWVAEKQIESCGVFYLVDVNLHIHICSFTPNLEAWPMFSYVTFHSPEAYEADEGNSEIALLEAEEECSYLGTKSAQWPSQPASRYLNIPAQEEGEEDERYRVRVAEEFREYFCGNPCWF